VSSLWISWLVPHATMTIRAPPPILESRSSWRNIRSRHMAHSDRWHMWRSKWYFNLLRVRHPPTHGTHPMGPRHFWWHHHSTLVSNFGLHTFLSLLPSSLSNCEFSDFISLQVHIVQLSTFQVGACGRHRRDPHHLQVISSLITTSSLWGFRDSIFGSSHLHTH